MKVTEVKIRKYEHGESGIHPRIFIHTKGENFLENLQNRHNRPYTIYKKEVLPKMLEILEKKNPEEFNQLKGKKFSWNQLAGCSCPCSPGFVVKDAIGRFDIYVRIEA